MQKLRLGLWEHDARSGGLGGFALFPKEGSAGRNWGDFGSAGGEKVPVESAYGVLRQYRLFFFFEC